MNMRNVNFDDLTREQALELAKAYRAGIEALAVQINMLQLFRQNPDQDWEGTVRGYLEVANRFWKAWRERISGSWGCQRSLAAPAFSTTLAG